MDLNQCTSMPPQAFYNSVKSYPFTVKHSSPVNSSIVQILAEDIKVMSNSDTRSTLIAIDSGNVVFKLICCHLLSSIYRKDRQKRPQQLYLINLASVAAFANVFLLVRDVFNLKRLHACNSTGAYNHFISKFKIVRAEC